MKEVLSPGPSQANFTDQAELQAEEEVEVENTSMMESNDVMVQATPDTQSVRVQVAPRRKNVAVLVRPRTFTIGKVETMHMQIS